MAKVIEETPKSKVDSLLIQTAATEEIDNTESRAGRSEIRINDLSVITGQEIKAKSDHLKVKEGFKQKIALLKIEVARTKKGHIIYEEHYTQFINSKMIGDKYLEGLTMETIDKAREFSNSIPNNIKLTATQYLNSKIADTDLNNDIPIDYKSYKEATYKIHTLLHAYEIEHTYYRNNGNITIGSRNNSNWKTPHISIYWKGGEIRTKAALQKKKAEITGDPNEIHTHYQELANQNIELARIEINLPDANTWKRAGHEAPEYLEELLLRNDSGEFNHIPCDSITKFYLTKIKQTPKTKELMKPTDFALTEMIKIMINEGYGTANVLHIARRYEIIAGAKKQRASELRAKLSDLINEVGLQNIEAAKAIKTEQENPLIKALGLI
ncbi:MAG: hypothetical protein [Microviridae sp.]|nr:MAG: hypothetical protein [Microviridae sp.]